jgi:hypothetical protein
VAIDGTYAVAYCGSIGLGVAMLKVDNGQVIGHDYVGSVIAGIATELPNGEIDLDISMLVQPGAHLVAGTSAQDLPYARGIKHRFPPEFGDGAPQTVLLTPGTMTVMVKRAADNWAPAATKGFSIQLKP